MQCALGRRLRANLAAALDLYADVLRRPRLPEEEVEAVKSLALQDLLGLEDEPAQRLFIELRQRHFRRPWARTPAAPWQASRVLT